MSGKDIPPRQRVPLLVMGVVSLALGILGGLWRIGWEPPLPGTQPATFHGALMAAAFFGTVIGLERAVGAAQRLAYLGPLFAGIGGIATAFGAPHVLAAALLVAGAAVLASLSCAAWLRQREPHRLIVCAGALAAVGGNTLWLAGFPASEALGGWIAFLVLTIAGERLELSHLRRPSASALRLLATLAAALVAGALALPLDWRVGSIFTGVALAGISFWLLANDVARRNLQHHGLMRFAAVSLVGGYVWLGIGGLLLPFAAPAGFLYDAALHAVFVGFVFAMVIGHAPMIFPGILKIAVPYTRLFYVHLALLNATLVLRIVGDLAQRPEWRAWGGLGNALALALFLLATATSAWRGRGQQPE